MPTLDPTKRESIINPNERNDFVNNHPEEGGVLDSPRKTQDGQVDRGLPGNDTRMPGVLEAPVKRVGTASLEEGPAQPSALDTAVSKETLERILSGDLNAVDVANAGTAQNAMNDLIRMAKKYAENNKN